MTLAEAIQMLALKGSEIYCKICTVDAVDRTARTVDYTPIDEGAPLVGVNLQANQGGEAGIVPFPAVGSYVVVAFISPSVAVTVLCEEIDTLQINIGRSSATITAEGIDAAVGDTTVRITAEGITFNGGKLGGLVVIEKLTQTINDLIQAFNTHTHVLPIGSVAVTGTATAQSNPAPVTVPAVTVSHPLAEAKNYEDNNVKH